MNTSEQELARALLFKAKDGQLAQHLAEQIRLGGADGTQVVAVLLATLMAKGAIPALEIARIILRAPQLMPEADVAIPEEGSRSQEPVADTFEGGGPTTQC